VQRERLTGAGYAYIGMDHFALPNDDLSRAMRNGTLHRNFQGYSTHSDCDLIGLGVSAIGSVGDSYAQNHKQLTSYYRALDEGRLPIERGLALTMDDIVRREIIQRLMCRGELVPREIEARYALDFARCFATELTKLQVLAADGLLSSVGDRITVSDRGRALLRNVAMVFDAPLRHTASPLHSKVI
jgi:oxygen-independent coproporphyrinogen-3 oxidase